MIKGREEIRTLDELAALQGFLASMESIVKKAGAKSHDLLETQFWQMIHEWAEINAPSIEDVKRCRDNSYFIPIETAVDGNFPSMTLHMVEVH